MSTDTATWNAASSDQRTVLASAFHAKRCGRCDWRTQCACETRIWEIHALETLSTDNRTTVATVRHETTRDVVADITARMTADPSLLFAFRSASYRPWGNWGSLEFAREFFRDEFGGRTVRPGFTIYEWTFVKTNAEAAAFTKWY
jgi:hypothetical protein